MASYLPHHNAPRLWESEMQTPGPAKRQVTAAIRSGSGRSFASTWKPGISFSRSGQIAQQATGQYGNYLLYRDQVRAANAHLEHEIAKEQGAHLNAAAGNAANSMLGGPTPASPSKSRSMARGSLGPPSTTSAKPVGPSQTAKVQPTATPEENASAWGGAPQWAQKDSFGTNYIARQAQPVQEAAPMKIPDSQRGFKRPGMSGNVLEPGISGVVGGAQNEQLSFFGRQGFQPDLPPGDTRTPQGTALRGRRASVKRPAGGNLGGINYNT